MEAREVMTTVIDELLAATRLLIERGYRVTDSQVYTEYFGNAWMVLTRDDVRLRAIYDRGQWFMEIGSIIAPEEWFDARMVLTEVGGGPADFPPDRAGFESLCELLADTADRWEILFLRTTFGVARKALRERELASAKMRFGYDPTKQQ